MEGTPSFGYWVRRQRKALDLTRDEVARRVGCAAVTIKKIESDERRPSLQIAERLAEVLAIAAPDRTTFLRTARGDLSPLHLPLPAQPIVAARTLPSTLSRAVTPLIGRAQEIVRVHALLMRDEVRLLTLTGPGGTGKTRLASEVALEVHEEFADGVYFVSLASVLAAEQVVATIGQVLGVVEVAGQSPLARVQEFLAHKQILLVLDNFEHLLAAAAEVGDLLTAAPEIKILVTSRSVLQIYGEHEFLVPPLALANLHQLPPLADLKKIPAIALFVQRAQAAQPDFAITEQNARAIAELCARLDGLPLALELAAARVKLFPPETLLAHLADRLNWLGGGSRNLPERQQTLTRTLDWSYQLLAVEEQVLLRRLAVFAGGCSWEAIAAVTSQLSADSTGFPDPLPTWTRTSRIPRAAPPPLTQIAPSPQLLAQIESLLNKSLIRTEEGAGEPRVGLLETIRAYALDRLQQAGEDEDIHRQHLHYYVRLAEAAYYHITGGDAPLWFARLALEHRNLSVALGWALTHQPAVGLRLAVALGAFWDTHGRLIEGRRWLEQLLTAVESTTTPNHPPTLPSVARLELARAAFRAGNYAEQGRLASKVAAVAREMGNLELLTDALVLGGMAYTYAERYVEGVDLLEEALALARSIHYPMGAVTACQTLGVAFIYQQQPARAVSFLEESLQLAQAVGAVRGVAIARSLLGVAALARNQVEVARQRVVESITACAQIQDRVLLVYPLVGLIQVAGLNGQFARAAKLVGAVDALLKETGAILVPVTHATLHQEVTTLSAHLGDESFMNLRKEGLDMSFEAIVTFALATD